MPTLENKIAQKRFSLLRNREIIVSIFAICLASLACNSVAKNNQNPTSSPVQGITPETVQSNPSPQSTVFPFRIVPYNYSLVDAGNGWKKGEVYLALENATNANIDLSTTTSFQSESSKYEWIIETAEGATYPAQLYQWGMGVPEIELPFEGVIPPGFRFTKYETFYDNILLWQSANAATPTRVTVKDHPEISFDLPPQNQTISFPFEASPTSLILISSWANKDAFNQPNELQITFTGRCGNLFYFRPDYNETGFMQYVRTLYVEVQVTNHDKFNQHRADLSIPYMIFERNGFIRWAKSIFSQSEIPSQYGQSGFVEVGPDQSLLGYFTLIGGDYGVKDDPLPIVMIWNGQEYQVFDGASCTQSPPPTQ